MSTNARISIRLKPKSKGLLRFHVREWRDTPARGYYDAECNLLVNDNVMTSFVCYDGYIEGVGYRLLRELRTYDEVFEFIIHGNRSSYDSPLYEANMPWEKNKPKMAEDFPDNLEPVFDYYYKWDSYNGEEQWLVRKHSEKDYTPLKYFFPPMKIEKVE